MNSEMKTQPIDPNRLRGMVNFAKDSQTQRKKAVRELIDWIASVHENAALCAARLLELEPEFERLREALQECRSVFTKAYTGALEGGCDSNGAYDCAKEDLRDHIKEALK